MSDLRATIYARVDAILRELEALARDAALSAVQDALRAERKATVRDRAPSAGTKRARAPKRAKVAKRRPAAQPSAPSAGRSTGTLRERVLRALAAGGAMGRSQVAKALGVTPKAVEAPLRLLFNAGSISRSGTGSKTAYAAKK